GVGSWGRGAQIAGRPDKRPRRAHLLGSTPKRESASPALVIQPEDLDSPLLRSRLAGMVGHVELDPVPTREGSIIEWVGIAGNHHHSAALSDGLDQPDMLGVVH